MKLQLSIVFICISILLTPMSAAAGIEDAAHSLYERIGDIKTMGAKFKQQIVDRDGLVMQESHGEFALQRPNLIYWKTEPPYEQEIIGDGDILWVYDADLEQVTQYPNGDLLKGPMALFSKNLDEIKARFHVSLRAEESKADKAKVNRANTDEMNANKHKAALIERFTLVPKNKSVDEGFSEIVFEFRKSALGAIEIKDRLQQRTILSLDALQMNHVIPVARFQFTPPEGVDVLINE